MQNYRIGYVDSADEAVAVFIDSADDCNFGMLMSYMRMGEHGEAAIDWIRDQPLAGADLYQGLHRYLSRRYAETPGDPVNLIIDQEAVPR